MRPGIAAGLSVGLACGVGADDGLALKNIVVIAGQSNAKGVDADIDSVTVYSGLRAAYPSVTVKQKFTDIASDPLVWTVDQVVPLGPRPDDLFGVDVTLGRYVNHANPGRWAIAKFAVPSTSLGQNWRVDASFPTSGPNLYTQMIQYMQLAERQLAGRVVAFIWIQGETDAGGPTLASAYETNLTNLFNGIRGYFPGLPILFNRLHTSYAGSDTATVRTAQANVDTAVAGTTMINVDDLTIVGAHFDANSYATLGDRFALQLLQQLGTKIPPFAGFTSVNVAKQVTFTDASRDDDGTITARLWSFGDGTTSTATNPVKTYATDGTYSVTLLVTDNDGRQDVLTRSITVVTPAVTVDGTSGISVPIDATEWATLNSTAGLATGVPDHLYLCQEASGDLIDSIAGVNLTATNTPLYQQTVTGWSRKGVGWSDAGVARFQRTTTFTAPSAEAYFFLAYYASTGSPAATRFAITLGTSVSAGIAVLTTGKLRTNAGANVANATNNLGTNVRPLALLADSTNNVTIGADDQETMTPTHLDAGTAGVYIPGTTTPGGRLVYLAIWRGTKAEAFSRTNIKALQQALGWTVGWTP